MRLLIVRHGAPNYEKDTLTEQGWKEAELLAPHLVRMKPDHICLSIYGRAQDTAKRTLELTGITPEIKDWLCEFDCQMPPPFDKHMWHMDPKIWTADPQWRSADWKESPLVKGSDFLRVYEEDRAALDAYLAEHGYVRDGMLWHVSEEFYDVNETIVFFCHLGRGLILLSQLLDMPWISTAHQFWLPTSSVTEIIFERSRFDRSIAIPRVARLSDVSHLEEAGLPRCNSGFMMPVDGYTRASDPTVHLSK